MGSYEMYLQTSYTSFFCKSTKISSPTEGLGALSCDSVTPFKTSCDIDNVFLGLHASSRGMHPGHKQR